MKKTIPLFFLSATVLAADPTSPIIQSVQNGIGLVGNVISAIGVSQQQTQTLFNQANALQSNSAAMNTQQNAFNQTLTNLSQALAEAQMCSQNATADTNKFKKATIPASNLSSTDITCVNYGNIIDSGKKNILELEAANKKFMCINKLQEDINRIANSAKAPFDQLTKAANENWNIRDQIINMHKDISDNLTKKLEGEDGKSGLKQQLNELKKLNLKLIPEINGDAGFNRKLELIRRSRISTANQWQFSLLEETNSCFFTNTALGCDSNGTPLSPVDCIFRSVAGNPGRNTMTAAKSGYNVAALKQVMQLNAAKARNATSFGNIDVKHIDNFLKYSKTQFNNITEEQIKNFLAKDFRSGVNVNEITTFYRDKLNTCYDLAVKNFRSGIESEGNPYKESLNKIVDTENNLLAETEAKISEVQQKMNEFQTAFSDAYKNELPQFANDCTSEGDVSKAVDCLKVFSATLSNGIEGTDKQVKLSNGTIFKASAGITNLNLQKLDLDANGKPSIGGAQLQCRGFNECIKFMEKSRDSHVAEEKKQTQEREKFVIEHNKNIDTALGGVAATFDTATQLLSSSVAELNQLLATAGVKTIVKTKLAEGENLEPDDKTKLYKSPKNMKAVIAGAGSFTELDKNEEFITSVNKRIEEINKAVGDAFKKKAQCSIKTQDYVNIANGLGDCSRANFCRNGDITPRILEQLEALVRKSFVNVDDTDKNSISSDYKSCVNTAKSNARSDLSELRSSDETYLTDADKAEGKKKYNEALNETNKIKNEEIKACGDEALNKLRTMGISDAVRDEKYRSNNGSTISGLIKINDACTVEDPDQAASDVEEACSDLKDSLEKAKIPTDEGETPDGDAPKDKYKSPLRNESAK